MLDLIDFTPDVLAAAPGCPGFTAKRAVLAAAIEFAEMTWCLQSEHDPFDLEAGIAEYELDAPYSQRITGIINVRINGEAIDPATVAEKDRGKTTWRTETAQYPDCFLRDKSRTITTLKMYPLPLADVDDAVTTLIASTLKRDAVKIPDEFGENYFEAIVAGATSRVLFQPGQPWGDIQIAPAYRNIFLGRAYSARNQVMGDTLRRTVSSKVF